MGGLTLKEEQEFLDAAAHGKVARVQAMVMEDRGLTEVKDEEDRSALQLAIEGGHINVVGCLLDVQPELIERCDATGSAMITAAENGQCDILEMLIRRQHAPQEEQTKNEAAAFRAAATCRQKNIVRMFLDRRPELAAMTDEAGYTALHCAAYSNDRDIVEAVLRYKPELSVAQDHTGWTALHIAACIGSADLARQLLEVGGPALAEIRNKRGERALDIAWHGNPSELLDILDRNTSGCRELRTSDKGRWSSTTRLAAKDGNERGG
jgi:ankyrin repeat protein